MCVAANELYEGERVFEKRVSKLIPPGCYCEELVADCIEMGLGI